jgi:hypothetical protein
MRNGDAKAHGFRWRLGGAVGALLIGGFALTLGPSAVQAQPPAAAGPRSG